MKKNVGSVDSYIRYALGFGFVVLAFTVSYWFLIGAGVSPAGTSSRSMSRGFFSFFTLFTNKKSLKVKV